MKLDKPIFIPRFDEEPTASDLALIRAVDLIVKIGIVLLAIGFIGIVIHAFRSGAVDRLVR